VRVLVTIQHPAHVHFFRNAVSELRSAGHEVHVFARRNEVTVDLLETYGIEHAVLAGESDSLGKLAVVQATYEARLLQRARRLDPDVMAAIGGVAVSHVAKLVGARSVVFYDTEHATIIRRLAYPFADEVCTPDCYTGHVGSGHTTYPGYHELAYLHPDRYSPDDSVLADEGLAGTDTLAICRFSSWDSSHDLGQGGFDDPADVVEHLHDVGATVRLTSETDLPPDLERFRLSVAPERMHDLLYHADLYVGEGATTAAEAAILGTPAVYVNTLTMGYTTELEERYGLLFQHDGPNRHVEGILRARELAANCDGRRWERRRDRLLSEKHDTTEVVLDRLLRPAAEVEEAVEADVKPGA
jgi:predicted glycosyltransferase